MNIFQKSSELNLSIWIAMLAVLLTCHSGFAGSAAWSADPASEVWDTAANWNPNTVPNGPDDIASFNTSARLDPFILSSTELNALVFNTGASVFDIATDGEEVLTISGTGIVNNSGFTQRMDLLAITGDPHGGSGLIFSNHAGAGSDMFIDVYAGQSRGQASYVEFHDSATAGNAVFVTMASSEIGSDGGMIRFEDQSTAATGSFTNKGSTNARGKSGGTQFSGNATAGEGVFVNGAATKAGGGPGLTQFFHQSSADHGTFTSDGSTVTGAAGGATLFFDDATAANATLIANGGAQPGLISFAGESDGGEARVELFKGGILDISGHNAPGLSIGSLEGDGTIDLGANNLTAGTNDLDTELSGIIADGGSGGGTGGSLSKAGSGALTLSGLNTYTGGTFVDAGTLIVKTGKGSATGPGPVQVNAGTIGGRSNIAGPVMIGSGSGTGAFLTPGITGPGMLTIKNSLGFQPDGVYQCDLSLKQSKADKVSCKSVSIAAGAQFILQPKGNQTLASGTVFTVINNAGRKPIRGAFVNLPDGATIDAGPNTLRANYEGGDGNDLTLTVVP